jgi:phosphoribosylglycinamide formyltransferase-1
MLNIAVLVSGSGTNLQALIDAVSAGDINGRIAMVISSKAETFALERAAKNGIESRVIERKCFASQQDFDLAILSVLRECGAELVVLAGFLCILGNSITEQYNYRIINVHPSLIPAFCGAGYYGLKVHEAVLDYGVRVTGATVHFVNDVTDGGAIILQKAVEVKQGDTPKELQLRVMKEAEWEILPHAVALFCDGRLSVKNNKVVII